MKIVLVCLSLMNKMKILNLFTLRERFNLFVGTSLDNHTLYELGIDISHCHWNTATETIGLCRVKLLKWNMYSNKLYTYIIHCQVRNCLYLYYNVTWPQIYQITCSICNECYRIGNCKIHEWHLKWVRKNLSLYNRFFFCTFLCAFFQFFLDLAAWMTRN